MVFEYILNQNHIDPATDLTIDQNIDFGSYCGCLRRRQIRLRLHRRISNLVQPILKNRVRDTLSPLLERTAAMFRTLLSLQRRVTSTNIRKSSRDSPMHCKKVWTTWHPTHRKTLPRQSLLSSKRPHWIRSQPSFPAIMSRIHGKKDLIFRQESFDLLQDILEEAGELKERAPYKDLVTTTYAEKAAKTSNDTQKTN